MLLGCGMRRPRRTAWTTFQQTWSPGLLAKLEVAWSTTRSPPRRSTPRAPSPSCRRSSCSTAGTRCSAGRSSTSARGGPRRAPTSSAAASTAACTRRCCSTSATDPPRPPWRNWQPSSMQALQSAREQRGWQPGVTRPLCTFSVIVVVVAAAAVGIGIVLERGLVHLDAVAAIDRVDPPRCVAEAVEGHLPIRIERTLGAGVLVRAVHGRLQVQPGLTGHGLPTNRILHLDDSGLIGTDPIPARGIPQLPSALEALVDDLPLCVNLFAVVKDTTPLLLLVQLRGWKLNGALVRFLQGKRKVCGVARLARLAQKGIRPHLLPLGDVATLQAHVAIRIWALLRAGQVGDVVGAGHVVVHLADVAVEVQSHMPLAAIRIRTRRPNMLPLLFDAREGESAFLVAMVVLPVEESTLLVVDVAFSTWTQDDVSSLALQVGELLTELRAVVAVLLGQIPHP
mmetsp:Transcript_70132/g.181866  ORF Transcript_70132/g.181866 Transcript_70132/m.181866 type:complete len:454 (+) Transcript_70132:698-2059(+)